MPDRAPPQRWDASLAQMLAPRGIRVVAVAPGPISTPIAAHEGLGAEQIDALRQTLVEHVPLRRIGRPEEVAFWIVQLARPEAAFTTGNTSVVQFTLRRR